MVEEIIQILLAYCQSNQRYVLRHDAKQEGLSLTLCAEDHFAACAESQWTSFAYVGGVVGADHAASRLQASIGLGLSKRFRDILTQPVLRARIIAAQ